jgi:hypothetical protein
MRASRVQLHPHYADLCDTEGNWRQSGILHGMLSIEVISMAEQTNTQSITAHTGACSLHALMDAVRLVQAHAAASACATLRCPCA